jgi:hypothetical protein
MEKTNKNRWIDSLKQKPILSSLLVFTLVWFLSFLLSQFVWRDSLPKADLLVYGLSFLIPFFLVGGVSAWSKKHEGLFWVLAAFFLLEFLFVFLNAFFFHIRISSYGDNGQLSSAIANQTVLPRWMLGSSLLNFIYKSIFLHLPVVISTIAYVRLAGSAFMCLFSILLIKKFPSRFAMILPMLTPIWIILAVGYDEYYPFITPMLLFMLVLLSEDILQKINPFLMGLIVSAIGLLYAGFVPFAAFILAVYCLRRGALASIKAVISTLLFLFLLIKIFWPDTIPAFFIYYYSSLNIGDASLYPGQFLAHTPFFKPQFAFSATNFRRLFFIYYWAGGLSPLLILAACGKLFKRISLKLFKNLTSLAVLFLFLWQAFYFVFMIPRLGAVNDIDLFFSVYITFAFFAGWMIDKLLKNTQPEIQSLIKNVVFAAFAGNSALAIVYFAFVGLPLLP